MQFINFPCHYEKPMFCTGNYLHWLNAKGILGCIRQSRTEELILALFSALLRHVWASDLLLFPQQRHVDILEPVQ